LGKKLAIFIINDSNLNVKVVDISEKEISNRILEFRQLIGKFENGISDKTSSEKLEEILNDFYKLLIEPIKEYLSREEEIVIVPHANLHLIPFQALKSQKFLIEEYKLCFAQSASSLKFLKKGFGKGVLVVGNPTKDLPFAEDEALEVGKILKTDPILRDEAKKDIIIKAIKNKEILHFACHGFFDPFNPAFSRIILSDGNINAIDFMNLDMDANLTILSACETALAEILHGDEVEGLVRAIQYGGCRFVIASLWKVTDRSTKELFLNFYNGEGDIVNRLREAELSLMKNYGFFHWAPFQVYGI
jgi:CHAT domain-containing protein